MNLFIPGIVLSPVGIMNPDNIPKTRLPLTSGHAGNKTRWRLFSRIVHSVVLRAIIYKVRPDYFWDLLLCRNTHEREVHTRTMKMPFQNLFILGFVHPFTWEIL